MRVQIVLASLAATVCAQGVTAYIAPPGKAPAGCQATKDGKYELSVEPIGKKTKRAVMRAQDMLTVTLAKGVLVDGLKRVGYIADNFQFQFDGPPQAGALFTGGWSFCNNGSLALGASTIFYQCLSGSFYNLYDRWWAEQCKPIHIQVHSLDAVPAAPGLDPSAPGSGSATAKGTDAFPSPSSVAAKASGSALGSKTSGSASASTTPFLDLTGSNSSVTLLNISISTTSSSSSSSSEITDSITPSAKTPVAKTSSTAKSTSTNVANHFGLTGASNVALLMGVLGVMVA